MQEKSVYAAHEAVQRLINEVASALNRWKEENSPRDYWRAPLAGVADASDPLFLRLKQAVGPDHALPRDLLPSARSVIVFFLPFKAELAKQNEEAGVFAARSWAESYVVTNRVIHAVNDHLAAWIARAGYEAGTTPATHNFDEKRLISPWSHKHVGYIAGLGTFGLHHLLITESGCCGRLGSLVTSMPLPATARPDRQWCTEKAGGECRACVVRCMYGALASTPFNRHACYEQCLRNDAHHADLPLTDVCGKCSCGVPCSGTRPGASL